MKIKAKVFELTNIFHTKPLGINVLIELIYGFQNNTRGWSKKKITTILDAIQRFFTAEKPILNFCNKDINKDT